MALDKIKAAMVAADVATQAELDASGIDGITSSADATAMTIDSSEDITYTGHQILPRNKKVKQKGAFMESSTYQAMFLGG